MHEKFHENISKGFRVVERTLNHDEGTEGQNVDGVMVLVLCTSSDDALDSRTSMA